MLSWGYKLFCEFKVHDHVLDEKWEFFARLSIYHHQVIKVQVRHWKATWYSLIEDVWPSFFAVQDFGVFQCFMGPNGEEGRNMCAGWGKKDSIIDTNAVILPNTYCRKHVGSTHEFPSCMYSCILNAITADFSLAWATTTHATVSQWYKPTTEKAEAI